MEGQSFLVQVLKENELPDAVKREAGFSGDRPVTWSGQLYMRAGEEWITFPAQGAGEWLAHRLTENAGDGRGIMKLEEAGRKLLSGCDEVTAEQLARRFGIRLEKERCVIVFENRAEEKSGLFSQLQELIPSEEGDLLVGMDTGTTALIKVMPDGGMEEIAEYTRAAIESAENEAGLQLKAGIGSCRDRWTRLAESYEEACLAVRIGENFHLPEQVLVYETLFLERLINEIPEKRRRELRAGVLGKTPDVLKTPEITETIRSFFQNDLSASATARALFIHRNTLNYRLERIRQETGLDIRRFRDAVILLILMKLG